MARIKLGSAGNVAYGLRVRSPPPPMEHYADLVEICLSVLVVLVVLVVRVVGKSEHPARRI